MSKEAEKKFGEAVDIDRFTRLENRVARLEYWLALGVSLGLLNLAGVGG